MLTLDSRMLCLSMIGPSKMSSRSFTRRTLISSLTEVTLRLSRYQDFQTFRIQRSRVLHKILRWEKWRKFTCKGLSSRGWGQLLMNHKS